MVIQHNIAAINSHRNLGINNAQTNKNLEKLSSGYRINRAGDDAAGLAISEKMRGQIRGLAMAEQNTSNGISLIQTAEGGLNETHAILQRMRELAVQASNGTYQDEDRAQINLEMTALKEEIDRISTSTHYNGIRLLDGSLDVNGVSSVADAATQAEADVTGITFTSATNSNSTANAQAGASFAANAEYSIKFAADGTVTGTIKGTDGKDYEIVGTYTGGNVANLTIKDSKGLKDPSQSGDADGVDATIKIDFGTEAPAGGMEITGKLSAAMAATANNSPAAIADQSGVAEYGIFKEGADLIFQIGANGTADQQVAMSVRDMGSRMIGIWDDATNAIVANSSINDIDVLTRQNANTAIRVIDAATNMVSSQRAELGALQNRLEHTLNNLGVTKENLTAAESTIRDVDMAKEMMEFTKNSILVQASQAMLAQANQLPQGVLSLLR